MRASETSVPASPAGGVTGQVERVTVHSDESGFCVLKVSVKGRRELCTVVGTVPAVSVGEWLSATGQWGIDPRHGPQFKADEIRTSAPDNAEGIERYLASGLIKGIGPAFAARLVKKFGKDVFTVIAEPAARGRGDREEPGARHHGIVPDPEGRARDHGLPPQPRRLVLAGLPHLQDVW